VSIVVEPGDGGSALVGAIAPAKTSIHVTIYLFSSSQMQQALINAHKAGVEVKVILQKTFPPGGTSNQQAYTQLTKAGISVAWASTAFTLTHEKCVIIAPM
jgi:cardiolipin synthase